MTEKGSQPPIDVAKIEAIVSRFQPGQGSVIHALQALQAELSYVPEQGMRTMAEKLRVPLAKIYGVASFYKQIHLKPRGKHIVRICKGTACHVRGAQLIEDEFCRKLNVKPGATTADLEYTLEAVNCVGACGMAPVVVIDEVYHAGVRPDKAVRLLDKGSEE
jgi:NADH-quinone oxidoreductase subunit E